MLKKYVSTHTGSPVYLDLSKASAINILKDGMAEIVFGQGDTIGVYTITADESMIDRDIAAPSGSLWEVLRTLGWVIGCDETGERKATRENGRYIATVRTGDAGRVEITVADRNSANIVHTEHLADDGPNAELIQKAWENVTQSKECLTQDVLVELGRFGWTKSKGLYGHRMVKRNTRYETCAESFDGNTILVIVHQIGDMRVPVCDPLKFPMTEKGSEVSLAGKIDETVIRNYGNDLELLWINVLKDTGWSAARDNHSKIYALEGECGEPGYSAEITVLKDGRISMYFRNRFGEACDSIAERPPVNLMQPALDIRKAVQKACRLAYELDRTRKNWEPPLGPGE